MSTLKGRANLRALRRLALGAILASVAFGTLGAGPSVGATGPAVIRLTDVQVTSTVIGTPNRAGTMEIYRQSLYGSTSKTLAIGHGDLTCLAVSGQERRCDAGYVLPRGTIMTGAIVQSRLFYTAAITGGTGLYDNARGTLTVTATRLSPRREILLFRLSG
jgi:hypothetical protein